MKLSIIIPVFNEEKTVTQVLQKIHDLQMKPVVKEIIVVEDGSTDKTVEKIKAFQKKYPNEVILNLQDENRGKGAAVIAGIRRASGDFFVIQDADLEYDPEDIPRLLDYAIQNKKEVVYGTRLKRLPHFSNEERRVQFFLHYAGNKGLSLLTSLLYGQWVTDMETCYKLIPTVIGKKLTLHAKGFEFEPEITAKLMKQGIKIVELPITTKPRGYDEGKKLNTVRDGIKAVWTLIKYRFTD